jgi:hypothetical protein
MLAVCVMSSLIQPGTYKILHCLFQLYTTARCITLIIFNTYKTKITITIITGFNRKCYKQLFNIFNILPHASKLLLSLIWFVVYSIAKSLHNSGIHLTFSCQMDSQEIYKRCVLYQKSRYFLMFHLPKQVLNLDIKLLHHYLQITFYLCPSLCKTVHFNCYLFSAVITKYTKKMHTWL